MGQISFQLALAISADELDRLREPTCAGLIFLGQLLIILGYEADMPLRTTQYEYPSSARKAASNAFRPLSCHTRAQQWRGIRTAAAVTSELFRLQILGCRVKARDAIHSYASRPCMA